MLRLECTLFYTLKRSIKRNFGYAVRYGVIGHIGAKSRPNRGLVLVAATLLGKLATDQLIWPYNPFLNRSALSENLLGGQQN